MNRLLRSVLEGAIGGAVGTVFMSGVMAAGSALGLLGEPPPKKLVGKAMAAFGLRRRGPLVDVVATFAHLAFGAGAGAVFGVGRAAPVRLPPVLAGIGYGALVWTVSYAGWIPKAGLILPPSLDRPGRQPVMLAAHLVYGAVLGGVCALTETRLEEHEAERQ